MHNLRQNFECRSEEDVTRCKRWAFSAFVIRCSGIVIPSGVRVRSRPLDLLTFRRFVPRDETRTSSLPHRSSLSVFSARL